MASENTVVEKLRERVKELNTLYRISKVMSKHDLSLDISLKRIVEIMPLGWQYPEICCARIRVDDIEVTSPRFKEGEWKQAEPVVCSGKIVGQVEVHYLAQRPMVDEGPFLLEERNLLMEISERVSELVRRKQYEEELNNHREKYMMLFDYADEAICVCCMDRKGRVGNFFIANDMTKEVLGYSDGELAQMTLKDVIEVPEGTDMRAILGDLAEKKYVRFKASIRPKEGVAFPALVSFHLLDLLRRRNILILIRGRENGFSCLLADEIQ